MTPSLEPPSRSLFRLLLFRSARPDGGRHPSDASCAGVRHALHPHQRNPRLVARRSTAELILALAVAMTSVAHAQDRVEADTTPPSLVGQQNRSGRSGWLELYFSEELISFPRPDTSSFTVTADGVPRSVSSLGIMGSGRGGELKPRVRLYLPLPVHSGETAVISYTPPATHPIRDLSGNAAAAFSVTIPAAVTATAPPAPRWLDAKAGTVHVTLTWRTPDNGSKTITGYEYRLKEGMGPFGAWTAIPNSGPRTTSYTVGSLTSGTVYTFEVQAKNGVGYGQAASASATPATTETVAPALAMAFTTNEDLRLLFDEVLDNDSVPGSSAFTVNVDGESSDVIHVAVDGAKRTVRLEIATRLTRFSSSDDITISYAPPVTNSIKDLAGNSAAAFTTMVLGLAVTGPDAPRDLEAESGDGQLTLTWRRPYDGGESIIGYEYRQRAGNDAFGSWDGHSQQQHPHRDVHCVGARQRHAVHVGGAGRQRR